MGLECQRYEAQNIELVLLKYQPDPLIHHSFELNSIRYSFLKEIRYRYPRNTGEPAFSIAICYAAWRRDHRRQAVFVMN